MSGPSGQYATAGGAVCLVGVLALIHGAVTHFTGFGHGFITPTDEMFIAGIMLLVGFWMVRHDNEHDDEQHSA